MADYLDLPVEALVEHWRRQAHKLYQAGLPVERVADSMRTAALQVETDWVVWLLEREGFSCSPAVDRASR